ncbi:MAG TPA: FAD-dependent thymidylate synthase [Conexivisphaerales archaeon]|nr:FAD-dependent thymidylate synthase [Conexivisphaerales archaeon]
MRRCYTTKLWEELEKDMETAGYPQYLTESAFNRLEFDVYEHARSMLRVEGEPGDLMALVQAHPQVSFTRLESGSFLLSLNLRTMTEMARHINCTGRECAFIAEHVPRVSETVAHCIESGARDRRFSGERPGSSGASETDFRLMVVQHLTTGQVREMAGTDLSARELLKHSFATIEVEGISRAASHQLVRHRLFSFSQESQRFSDAVNESGVVPPSITADDATSRLFSETMRATKEAYSKLRDHGIKKEDARFVLPTALKTKILMTGSMYQIEHASFYRSSFSEVGNKAQWEINRLFTTLYGEMRKGDPSLPERIEEI